MCLRLVVFVALLQLFIANEDKEIKTESKSRDPISFSNVSSQQIESAGNEKKKTAALKFVFLHPFFVCYKYRHLFVLRHSTALVLFDPHNGSHDKAHETAKSIELFVCIQRARML